MIKVFYTNETVNNKKALYYSGYYCNSVIEYMKDYVKEERKSISQIDNKSRDYVLIDFAHELGKKVDIEIPFDTQLLHINHNYDYYIKPKELVNLLKVNYNSYVEHLLDSKKTLKENKISIIDSLFVLSDFLNYACEMDEEKEKADRQVSKSKIYEMALSH